MSSDEATRAAQDELIERVNRMLERDEWYAASEMAYEALALDSTYFRAANALLRCYLHRDTLREMERTLFRLFHPQDPNYDAPHQHRRRLAYSYRCLSMADLWHDWYGGDRMPPALDDVSQTLEEGFSALIAAYCIGEEGAYERARSAFAQAESNCADRPALYWYLARLYADLGFFEESAEALAHLVRSDGGKGDPQVQRLWAEMAWWGEYGERLPWIH